MLPCCGDFTEQLENDMRAICDEMDIGIDIDLWMDEEPVPMNKELVATLTELCESEKLNYRVMHSGAGHDAQIFAPRVPTCMIFMPSINGISHNPAERTNIDRPCRKGSKRWHSCFINLPGRNKES